MSHDADVRREVLLVEYQKAQDSAEHHDNFVGNVTSLWLGSAVLMGFILSALGSNHAGRLGIKIALTLLIAVGCLLTGLVWTWADRAASLKKQKYARCKEIEEMFEMRQHCDVIDTKLFGQVPRTEWQTRGYRLLMILFIAAWVALLVDVWTL